MTTDEAIGQRVHQILWTRRIRQSDVCLALGVSRPTMSKRLRGERPWTVDELLALAAYLRVPITDLLPEWCAARDSNPVPAGYWPGTVTSLDAYRLVRRASQPMAVAA